MSASLTYPLISLNRLRMSTDGEGVTTLVAGAGCPLSCRYCINKEVLTKPYTPVTARQLYERTRIDDLYFQATCGGLTFGGGESLLHAPFIRIFRQEGYARGWQLNAETSLAVGPALVEMAAEAVDFFIVDIKSMDRQVYRDYTGQDLLPLVLDNLKRLRRLAGPDRIRVRVPHIPGYPDHSEAAAQALQAMGLTKIETFPYVLPR